MSNEKAPLTDESDAKSGAEAEKLRKCMKEHKKVIKCMSKYEKKLMKGLMRGFANTMILWLISKKRQHGYEIMTKFHESSTPYNDKMPSASKIYPVLHDLEKNGLIEGSWEHHGKRKVKYYEITSEGEKVLSRFRTIAQFARENKSSLWLEFMRDILIDKEGKRS